MEQQEKISLTIQPTPNPNALKFIANRTVLDEGKISYRNPSECGDIPIAAELFKIRGVDTLHLFQNTITVNKFSYEEWDELEEKILQTMSEYLPNHDSKIEQASNQTDRSHLSPELQKIEEILDEQIRPGLQGDGGDLACLSFKDDILIIKYQGACGSCPSSSMGTLEAIRGILRDFYDPKIEVYIAPE